MSGVHQVLDGKNPQTANASKLKRTPCGERSDRSNSPISHRKPQQMASVSKSEVSDPLPQTLLFSLPKGVLSTRCGNPEGPFSESETFVHRKIGEVLGIRHSPELWPRL